MENKAQLKRDYEEAAREIDKEISRIDETFKTIEKVVAPYKCKACGGTGQHTGVDAAGSREQKMPRHRLRPVHVLNQYSEKYRSLL